MTNLHVQDRTIIAGLTKGKQTKIQWLNATVPVGAPGQFTEINLDGTGFSTTVAGNRLTITFTGGGGSSPLTTKGDIWGFDTADNRIPVGANDKPLVADSTAALGVAYKTLPIAGGGTAATTALGARQNLDYEGAISFRLGRPDGAILLAGFQRVFLLPAAYDNLTTGSWEIVTFPASTCSIDIQYRTFGATRPSTSDSIVGATHPATAASFTATGATSGWTTSSIAKANYIAIQVISNDLASEIIFYMPGRKI